MASVATGQQQLEVAMQQVEVQVSLKDIIARLDDENEGAICTNIARDALDCPVPHASDAGCPSVQVEEAVTLVSSLAMTIDVVAESTQLLRARSPSRCSPKLQCIPLEVDLPDGGGAEDCAPAPLCSKPQLVDSVSASASTKRPCTIESIELENVRDDNSASVAKCPRRSSPTVVQKPSGRGLRPNGDKSVDGFEAQGLRVARCAKKLPKTQSWCFVPLIFSALGRIPERLRREGMAVAEQIEAAQAVWSTFFSHWSMWRAELRKAIDVYGAERFENDFLPRGNGSAKMWTTSLVYGEPREYGILPHPQGRCQDNILALLPCDIQNQIFASVVAIATA